MTVPYHKVTDNTNIWDLDVPTRVYNALNYILRRDKLPLKFGHAKNITDEQLLYLYHFGKKSLSDWNKYKGYVLSPGLAGKVKEVKLEPEPVQISDRITDIRVLQKQKDIYLRGCDGFRSWFFPVKYKAFDTYTIQVKRENSEQWEDISVVLEGDLSNA